MNASAGALHFVQYLMSEPTPTDYRTLSIRVDDEDGGWGDHDSSACSPGSSALPIAWRSVFGGGSKNEPTDQRRAEEDDGRLDRTLLGRRR